MEERIAAGQELRRRGSLSAEQDAALTELERRAGISPPPRDRSSLEDLALSTEATLRGGGRGFFGVGDVALGVNEAAAGVVENAGRRLVGREPKDFGGFQGAVNRQRARSDEVLAAAPVAGGAGTVAGALAPVPGAGVKAASTAVKGDSFARALNFVKGQAVRNTGRAAVRGGASGAVTEANLGGDAGDIATAGATSAVVAPAFGGIIRAGGGLVKTARNLLDKNAKAGFDALAKGLSSRAVNISPNELRRRAKEFFEATGRGATLAEILEPGGAQELRAASGLGIRDQRAKETLTEFAERQSERLQINLANRTRSPRGASAGGTDAGRVTTGTSRLETRRAKSFDKFMRENGRRTVTFTQEEAKELLSGDLVRLLPQRARRRLENSFQRGDDDVVISLRDTDNIRQAFNKAANAGGEAVRFRDTADSIRQIAAESIPEFDSALSEFARRSRVAEGVRRGLGVRSANNTEFRQTVADEDTATRAGVRTGIRTALSDAAGESPEAARNIASELARNSNLNTRIADLDPSEAQRLQRLGKAELSALQSVKETVRGTQVGAALEKELENVQGIVELGALTSGRGSAGFIVNVLLRTFRRIGVPPTAAEKLAKAATDPSRTEEVITILERVGVEPSAAQRLAQATARASGRLSGPAVAEENQQ